VVIEGTTLDGAEGAGRKREASKVGTVLEVGAGPGPALREADHQEDPEDHD